jgi:cytochrome c oxidase assembly protein Cox11
VLPWKFVPQQREVRVLPGETALAFYTATNNSDQDIIGVATYSVTPGQTAPYFSKIQCFCFEEQRLNAGETVDMPVFFYLDPDMLNDLNMKGIETVTLSYTFFSKHPHRDICWTALTCSLQRLSMTTTGTSSPYLRPQGTKVVCSPPVHRP